MTEYVAERPSDFYFCVNPEQVDMFGDLVTMVVITNRRYYDENQACSDWTIAESVSSVLQDSDSFEYFFSEEEEGSFSFDGTPEEAVGVLRILGLTEKQDLLVPFGHPTYPTFPDPACRDAGQAYLDRDGEPLYPSEMDNIGLVGDDEDDGEYTLPDGEPFDPALINPLGHEAKDAKDAMVIGRARITAAIANREKERLEAAKVNDCNIDIQQVNRYQAQWDASVIFRGFAYRLVMVKHPEVMRMYSKVSEVEEKLLEHLSEDDFHIGENPNTDEYEVYLKSPAILFLWKMNCPEWMAVNFDRIEQHTD